MTPEVVPPPARKRAPRVSTPVAEPLAPESASETVASKVVEAVAPDSPPGQLRETTGERMRELFEHRLPALMRLLEPAGHRGARDCAALGLIPGD